MDLRQGLRDQVLRCLDLHATNSPIFHVPQPGSFPAPKVPPLLLQLLLMLGVVWVRTLLMILVRLRVRLLVRVMVLVWMLVLV